MKIRVSTLVNIISASVLLASVFLIGSTTSQGAYDPWADINDDGYIELTDFFILSQHFGAEGTPITKAALEYDSGWIDITDKAGQYFNITHNLSISDLNNQNITIEIIGKTDLQSETLHRQLGVTSESQWSRTYGGVSQEMAYSVTQTADGGYALAGDMWMFGGATFHDFCLVKTDPEGTIEFARQFGGANADVAYSMVQTSDGGYALTGYTDSYGAGSFDFWLVKTDSSGTLEWSQTYGGANIEIAYAVIQTSDGGYAIAGLTDSFGAGNNDFWLVKTDKQGNMQWNQTYGGVGIDKGRGLVQTSDGGYAFAGFTDSYGAGSSDSWLIKTYPNGTLEWSQTYGDTNSDLTTSLVQTVDGGYALAGYTYSYGMGGSDFWLVKTDSSGVFEWNQTYGGAISDNAHSIVQTEDGGYVLVGETNSFGAGTYDSWLIKTYPNGTLEWSQTYGGIYFDRTSAVVQTSDGGYALAGYTESFAFDNSDFWLIKTGVESGLTWTDCTPDTLTLYRGSTDVAWNYVRVRIWKIRETP